MADEKREILIDVEVDAKDFDKEISKVNKELENNRKVIKELKKDYAENGEEIARLERKNKDLASSKRELIKESQTEANSLNALRLRLANLTKERNNLDLAVEGNAERFAQLQKEIKSTSDEVKAFEEEGGDFRRNVGNYSQAVRGFGLALKATGIGLIIAALAKLREAFLRNQKVLDIVTISTNAVSKVFDDLISLIVDNVDVVVDFFKDPLTSIKNLSNAIQEGIIKRFQQLIESVGFIGKAFKKLFEGDFEGALEAGKEAAIQFVDVFTGEDGGIETIKKAVNAVREYGKEVIETAKAQANLTDQARLNEAQQQRVIQQLERQTEIQRQIRDDETKSFPERIAANEKISKLLDQQAQIETGLLETRVKLARLNVEQNNNIENQIALQEALLAQEDTLNRIEGQRSEQLTNRVALEKEAIESFNELQEQFAKNEEERLKAEEDAAKESKKIQEARKAASIQAQTEVTSAIVGLLGIESAAGKAFALSQIIADSARGVSGAIAAGAWIQFPGNLAAIASGVASVLGGIAQAKTLLGESSSVPGISADSISTQSSTQASTSVQQPTLIQPQLLSQFSQPVQNQQDLVNAASSQRPINSVVSVVDITKGLKANQVKVSQSSL